MKPQDVIEQLVGKIESWDQLDTMAFVIYKPTIQGTTYDNATVAFDDGVVRCYDEAGIKVKTYAIKATLEEVTE